MYVGQRLGCVKLYFSALFNDVSWHCYILLELESNTSGMTRLPFLPQANMPGRSEGLVRRESTFFSRLTRKRRDTSFIFLVINLKSFLRDYDYDDTAGVCCPLRDVQRWCHLPSFITNSSNATCGIFYTSGQLSGSVNLLAVSVYITCIIASANYSSVPQDKLLWNWLCPKRYFFSTSASHKNLIFSTRFDQIRVLESLTG